MFCLVRLLSIFKNIRFVYRYYIYYRTNKYMFKLNYIRNCLPFRSTRVHPRIFVRFVMVARSLICSVMFCRSLFVMSFFVLAIVLSVLLRFMDSDYPTNIINFHLIIQCLPILHYLPCGGGVVLFNTIFGLYRGRQFYRWKETRSRPTCRRSLTNLIT